MRFGEQIRNLRERRGLKLEECADRMGVTKQCLSVWEHRREAPRSLVHAVNLAKVLEVPLEELVVVQVGVVEVAAPVG